MDYGVYKVLRERATIARKAERVASEKLVKAQEEWKASNEIWQAAKTELDNFVRRDIDSITGIEEKPLVTIEKVKS